MLSLQKLAVVKRLRTFIPPEHQENFHQPLLKENAFQTSIHNSVKSASGAPNGGQGFTFKVKQTVTTHSVSGSDQYSMKTY